MRTFIVYSFYLCGVVFLLYEIMKVQGLSLIEVLKEYGEKAKLEQESNTEIEKSSGSTENLKIQDQMTYVVVALLITGWSISYAIWGIIGLFSSQWVIFLALLILSMVVGILGKFFKNHLSLILRVDAIITVIILVFMFINRFHLHWI